MSVAKLPLGRTGLKAVCLDSLINPKAAFLELLIYGPMWILIRLIGVSADSLSRDHRDDPVYQKNLQRLIERNRQFEKKE
jgi:hypothetical protein